MFDIVLTLAVESLCLCLLEQPTSSHCGFCKLQIFLAQFSFYIHYYDDNDDDCDYDDGDDNDGVNAGLCRLLCPNEDNGNLARVHGLHCDDDSGG